MSLEIDQANEYLLGPADLLTGVGPLWRWADRGAVVCWFDGKTITFGEELLRILERLAPDGLPPLLAVLIVLSATRNNWTEWSGPLFLKLRTMATSYGDDDSLLDDVFAGLNRVSELHPDLRSSLSAKLQLFETIFEFCGERGTKRSAESVLWVLRNGSIASQPVITNFSDLPPKPRIVQHLSCLIEGLQCFQAERLQLRRETGLDETPEPADVDVPPGERVRGLLDELEDDAELCGLAALTRNLMAAMTLPRAVSEPDELPQGGVSDLTNRGPLDRLLLSELAHDDLTLAVRIATGSALYWRRERPPQPKPRQRSLLLEAGLRSWGVPRVFATAVALAVAATADRHTSLACHRARGTELAPVELTTRKGLVEHLAALETDAHPGAALPEFVEAIQGDEVDTDAVLVLAEDAFADRDFQSALSASKMSPLLIATVNRAGDFTLRSRTVRGSVVVREAKLDLETLFRKPKRKHVQLLDPSIKRDLPAILSMKPFPLRIPKNWNPKAMVRVEGVGVLEVDGKGRLLLWDRFGLGPRQLADDLPRGTLLWHYPDLVEGRIIAVVGHLNNAQITLVVVHRDSEEVEQHPLSLAEKSYRCISSHQGVLFAISNKQVESFGLLQGEPCGRLALDNEMRWSRDRFFLSANGVKWYAVSHDGQQPVFNFFSMGAGMWGSHILAYFDQHGIDGPIGVTNEGHLHVTASNQQSRVEHGLKPSITVDAISRRGTAVILSGKTSLGDFPCRLRVEVPSGKTSTVGNDAISCVEGFHEFVRPLSLRSRFHSIGLHTKLRSLVLLGKENLGLVYKADERQFILGSVYRSHIGEPILPFHPLSETSHRRDPLRLATWPDGSKAFLDTRGLLHLQSADKSIPEVSIVLRNGPLAGWCADGTLWGPRYFTGAEDDQGPTRHVWETAIEPFVRRLP
jgi:hypothetical protein